MFTRLMLVIFTVELAEMWLLSGVFDWLGYFPAALADGTLLVLLSALPIWFLVIRPLYPAARAEARVLPFAPARLFIRLLAVIFTVEFLVMLFLPFLPHADSLTHYFADTCFTLFLSAPMLWWVLSRAIRSNIYSVPDPLLNPIQLYVLLLGMVLIIDIVDMPLVNLLSSGATEFIKKITDSFLATVFVAPILWLLVIRPLRRAAQVEKTRSDAVQAQVVDAIVVIDEQGAIENLNPAAETIFGYSIDEITGKHARLLFSETDQSVNDIMTITSEPGRVTTDSVYHEVLGRRKDGSTFALDLSISPVKLEEQRQFLMIMRDISGRKVMEQALRVSEARFRSLSESAPVGVFHTDSEGGYLYINQRGPEITGLSPAEAAAAGWVRAVHPEDREVVFEKWRKSTAGGGEFLCEFRLLTPHGDVRWVLVRAATIRCLENKIIGYVGTYEDISDGKRSEQKLQKSLSLLTATLESTVDGILVVDATRRVQTFNQKFLDVWRIPRHVAEGSDSYQLLEFIREQLEDPDAFAARVNELYNEPESTALDIIKFKDGRVLERYSQPQMMEDERIGRVWSFRDITARMKAEEALKESEERYNIAVSGANEGIWDWNILTGEVYYTSRLKGLLGITDVDLEKVDAGTFEGLLHPDDHDKVVAAVRSHLHEHVPYDIECRLRTGSGEYRWFRARGQALRDDSGKAVRMAGSIGDITERKEAEQALQESETRFRQIFEQSEDAIIFFKPGACSIIDVNETTEILYGYTKAELKGGGLERLCKPEDFARLSRVISAMSHEGVSSLDRIVNLRKDGSEFIVSVRGKLIILLGVPIIFCTVRDISERVRMEEEARDIQAKLIHANKMTSLGLLVAGVAHEINNPNNFIMANSQILERVWQDALKVLREYYRDHGDFQVGGVPFSAMNEDSSRLFAGILDGSRRINDIVNNLKGFARQDRNATEHGVDVNRVVTIAVTMLHHQLIKHTDKFHLDLTEDIPQVDGSSQQLEQVVVNLLMNACQALPRKQCGIWVTTGYDSEAGQVTISVRDEGLGISGQVSNRMLEPFFTTKLDRGGTGLGLFISQSIIKEHDGTLEFTSEPGKGATFIVKIPAGKPASQEHSS
jgi:PAS domain S-box-containing protein